jgi:predicted N-acetyltransferase YhbS
MNVQIDPKYQNKGTGRQLMINALERAKNKNFPAIRLLQASYHSRSLALYATLGFEVREPISNMQGKPIQGAIPGRSVRTATECDTESCNTICKTVHGHDRLLLRHRKISRLLHMVTWSLTVAM